MGDREDKSGRFGDELEKYKESYEYEKKGFNLLFHSFVGIWRGIPIHRTSFDGKMK